MGICPIADVSRPDAPINREIVSNSSSAEGGGPRGAGLRILVVAHAAEERVRLTRLLHSCEQAGRLHKAQDATQALQLVVRYAVDVAFIPVQLHDVEGFDLVRLLRRFVPSLAVVFVSDDGSRALEAFDVGAIDFVSLAAGADRLARSLSRVPVAVRHTGETPACLPDATAPAAEVRWMEAIGGDYVRMHAAGGPTLVKGPLGALVSAWSSEGLLQIHRSYAVRRDAVAELRRSGRALLVVVDGRELPVSRRRAPQVRELLRAAGIEARRVGDGLR